MMNFADQDENNNEEEQDATTETGSKADGECCGDEECDNDKAAEEQDATTETGSKADGECCGDEECDNDKAAEVQDATAETGSEVAGECCGDEECDNDKAAEALESGDDSTDDAAASVGDFPVASLEMLLMTHHTQAVMALGMMPDPMSGETSANKDAAKFHIDMLSVIEEKTKGNLTSEEAESLSSILHQLRMAFFAA
jgi:hypothetical protein